MDFNFRESVSCSLGTVTHCKCCVEYLWWAFSQNQVLFQWIFVLVVTMFFDVFVPVITSYRAVWNMQYAETKNALRELKLIVATVDSVSEETQKLKLHLCKIFNIKCWWFWTPLLHAHTENCNLSKATQKHQLQWYLLCNYVVII